MDPALENRSCNKHIMNPWKYKAGPDTTDEKMIFSGFSAFAWG